MLVTAVLTVTALAFLVIKFGWRFVQRLVGLDWFVDIIVTVFFMWIFAITGTISGMMTGIIAGLMVSILLWALRMFVPHQRLTKVDGKLQWVETEGRAVTFLKEKMDYAA